MGVSRLLAKSDIVSVSAISFDMKH